MRLPPISLVRQIDTHRLIPSRYLPGGDSVLVAIADDDAQLQAIFELDLATTRAAEAKALASEVADRLLANPVIESYRIELESPGE